MLGSFRTFHDQCPVHIRVRTKFIGIFNVKGSGRFRAITFCFLTVVFNVVVALLGVLRDCDRTQPMERGGGLKGEGRMDTLKMT